MNIAEQMTPFTLFMVIWVSGHVGDMITQHDWPAWRVRIGLVVWFLISAASAVPIDMLADTNDERLLIAGVVLSVMVGRVLSHHFNEWGAMLYINYQLKELTDG